MKFIRALVLSLALIPLASIAGEAVDINTADAATLEQVKGIGPARASAIVQFRTENGPFASVDDLVRVPGIGERSVEQLRAQVTASKK